MGDCSIRQYLSQVFLHLASFVIQLGHLLQIRNCLCDNLQTLHMVHIISASISALNNSAYSAYLMFIQPPWIYPCIIPQSLITHIHMTALLELVLIKTRTSRTLKDSSFKPVLRRICTTCVAIVYVIMIKTAL